MNECITCDNCTYSDDICAIARAASYLFLQNLYLFAICNSVNKMEAIAVHTRIHD